MTRIAEASAVAPARTVSAAIVDTLASSGVRYIFGIPGVTNLEMFEAAAADDRVITITPRHEQSAVFMADGYARVTGEVGVAFLINGPGVTNALTAIIEAYKDSSPVAVFANEAPSHMIGLEKGSVHELPDQAGMVRSVVKWTARISRYAEASAVTLEALQRATAGRPRPVYVEIPLDVLVQKGNPAEELCVASRVGDQDAGTVAALREGITRAAGLLKEAHRPVLYAGAGLDSPAGRAALREFAEQTGMPVVTTVNGKDVFPGDDRLAVGASVWAKEIMESDLMYSADLVVAVGNRLSARYKERGDFRLPEKLIHIDIDRSEIGRNYPTAIGIVADGAVALRALAAAYIPDPEVRAGGFERALVSRRSVATALEAKAPVISRFMKDLREAIPRQSTIVSDNALIGLWAARYMPIYEGESFLYPMNYGTLGFALPAAIGAKLGRPDRPVVALSGDGGFLYSATELATAVQFGVDLTVVLINDRRWGSVHFMQRKKYGHAVASDLWTPDFAHLARAFGCEHRLVSRPEEIGPAVTEAVGKKGVQLLEVDGSFMDWY